RLPVSSRIVENLPHRTGGLLADACATRDRTHTRRHCPTVAGVLRARSRPELRQLHSRGRARCCDWGRVTGNSEVMLSIVRVRPSAVLRPRASATRSVFISRLSLPQSQQIDLLTVSAYHLE